MRRDYCPFLVLNINGISDHCKNASDKYVNEQQPICICLNETNKHLDIDAFTNYNTESSNKYRGVAILMKQNLRYTRLTELESSEIDSIFLVTIIRGHKVLISTAYIPPSSPQQMLIWLEQYDSAFDQIVQNNFKGMLFFGDLNARYTYCGDTTANDHATMLVDRLNENVAVINIGEPTFLASNGHSVIDLCILTHSLSSKPTCLTTDKETELFTGAPTRGHIPVCLELKLSAEPHAVQFKPWIEKADWESWRNFLEQEICDPFNWNDEPECCWKSLKSILTEATTLYIPTKRTNRNSKPFWNVELSKASNELRALRRKFKYNSNFRNGQHLAQARDHFKKLLSESASTWMSKILAEMGHKHGKQFWSIYNSLFKRKTCEMGPIKDSERKLLCEHKEIAELLKQTFFDAVHLKNHRFDKDHRQNLEKYLQTEVSISLQETLDNWQDKCSLTELEKALKTVKSSSFDNDLIHPKMLQNWGHNTKLAVLDLFNMCWTKSIWPWGTSKIIFIKKAGKSAYYIASSFRPISIKSHIRKLFERMIVRRLCTFLEEESIIEEEQEGFQRGKNTLRSFYRLDLECEWARTHEESAALLNVDIEKAFDSVWLDGLIYKLKNLKTNGKMIKMIDVFLRSRKGQIHLDPYTSPLFAIHIGIPQGSVLSPVLFIIFISDFLSNSLKCFKFSDDSSVLLSGQKNTKSLKDTCSDIKMWCRRWRMAVNG